jgi:hypothetical protein
MSKKQDRKDQRIKRNSDVKEMDEFDSEQEFVDQKFNKHAKGKNRKIIGMDNAISMFSKS